MTAPVDSEPQLRDGAAEPPAAKRGSVLVAIAIGIVLLAAIVLRFVASSALWLDEALSVNIARLPLGDLNAALKRDGAPPLYYVLLHGWMQVFGEGDVAVRALSGVVAVATLPVAWLVGRRAGGPTLGWLTVLVLAVLPFASRYGTEARMYSLVMLLVLLGWLAIQSALDRPRLPALVGVGLCSGLLLLTHYWAFYLVGATGAVLLVAAWRRTGEARRSALRTAVALAWILAHPSRPIPILGTQRPERMREAIGAFRVALSRTEWNAILVAAQGERLP